MVDASKAYVLILLCLSGSLSAEGSDLAHFNNYGSTYSCPLKPKLPAGNILDTALRYNGVPYSDSQARAAIDLSTGASFDCSTFITRVLLDQGYILTSGEIRWININLFRSPHRLAYDVGHNGAFSAGVVGMLIESHRGKAIDSTDELQRGDIVQFWYKKPNGTLGGHVGIVSSVFDDGTVQLFGEHGTYNKGGEVGLKVFDLRTGHANDCNKVVKAYAVRPLGNLIQKAPPSVPGVITPKGR